MERPSIEAEWSPATALETPPKKDGFTYRWIAEYVNGVHTPRNVQMAIREKYSRVRIEHLPDDFIVDEDSRGDGNARTGGLLLMIIPDEVAAARKNFYRKRSREGAAAANTLQGIKTEDSVINDSSRRLTGTEIARSA